MRNWPCSHHHFPAMPLRWMEVPSLLKVASDFPNSPDAQLFHTPTILGQRERACGSCSGVAAALVRLRAGAGAGWASSPPETDLPCLPMVPPTAPPCASAGAVEVASTTSAKTR